MAGSGPYAPVGGGWISGACSWYDKQEERKDKFLAGHPDWKIVQVRSMDQWEASTGDTDSELIVMQDRVLAALMDRLEQRFPDDPEPESAV
ncbi:MAG TPA: hypothetical protein VGD91_20910 [Trebonia sp.]